MDLKNKIGNDIRLAEDILRNGGLVGIPTETVYGLAANALDTDAVLKIFKVKRRPLFDPLILHVDCVEKAIKFGEFSSKKLSLLADKFWPGPLTILVPKKEIVPLLVTSGLEKVGLRIPNHPLTLDLLSNLDFPLAAPSANPFGYISPTHAQHVADQLGDEIDYILEGGNCKVGIESTIVTEEKGEIVICRLGGVSVEEIEAVVGRVGFSLNKSSNPNAPGQLKSHYSPLKPMELGDVNELLVKHQNRKVAVLSFYSAFNRSNIVKSLWLSESGSYEEAARNLFAYLRILDQCEADIILAERLPETFLGRAINDRLNRAAAEK